MRVGVVGCGTAGAASALFLHRAGHSVEVLERFDDPLPVGAGLLLQPTGMAALKRLGLAAPLREAGARIERLLGETDRGRSVMDMAYGDLRDGTAGLGVHRGALFMLLFDALRADGVDVRCGVAVSGLERGPEGVLLVDGRGEGHGPYDLVVAADGARSVLRGLSGLAHRVDPYPWGALWAIVEDPGEAFAGALAQVYRGTRAMVGFLPTGRSPHLAGDRPTVSLFWSVRVDALAEWRRAGIAAWRAEVCALAPRAAPLVEQLDSADQVLFAGYNDVRMPRWHGDDVVVVGDAGHAMSPQLGQGANLALLDGMALGDCLAGATSRRELSRRLAEYQRRRRGNLRFYARASRWMTPFFQSSHGILGPSRDRLMPAVSRVPWVRRQMMESLSGVKTGVFRWMNDLT